MATYYTESDRTRIGSYIMISCWASSCLTLVALATVVATLVYAGSTISADDLSQLPPVIVIVDDSVFSVCYRSSAASLQAILVTCIVLLAIVFFLLASLLCVSGKITETRMLVTVFFSVLTFIAGLVLIFFVTVENENYSFFGAFISACSTVVWLGSAASMLTLFSGIAAAATTLFIVQFEYVESPRKTR